MNQFSLPVKIYFGKDTKEAFSDCRKPFVVCDPFFSKSELLKKITDRFSAFALFDDFTPDPTLASVTKGITAFLKSGADSMIALGGGSAIDTAKAILLFSIKSGKAHKVPLIAVPTTSGTGSEVTSFSVVTDEQSHTKHPLVTDDMLPSAAVLDLDFVRSVPPKVVADTGADVLCHALESYVSIFSNPFTDALCEKAVQIVFSYLPLSVSGDEHAREQMHFASCMAGLAFNQTNLGLCHAIAHNTGARLHLPHGRTNAVLLPHVIRFNAGNIGFSDNLSQTALKYAHMAKLLGANGAPALQVKKLISEIERLFAKIGLPNRFSAAGIDLKDAKELSGAIAKAALSDGCLKANPIQPTQEQIENLYKGAI